MIYKYQTALLTYFLTTINLILQVDTIYKTEVCFLKKPNMLLRR